MKSTRFDSCISRARRVLALGVALAVCLLLPACDRGSNGKSNAAADSQPATAPAQHAPMLVFPAEVRASNPEIAAFLDEFLSTWLSTDYLAYRRLVSRAHTPESRERFELICQATAAVRVDAIEPIESPFYPDRTFRVVFDVELTPEAAERRREVERKIAILVFPELNEWRMAAAPAEYQPEKETPPTTEPAGGESESDTPPPSTAPSYPWDEEGDY